MGLDGRESIMIGLGKTKARSGGRIPLIETQEVDSCQTITQDKRAEQVQITGSPDEITITESLGSSFETAIGNLE